MNKEATHREQGLCIYLRAPPPASIQVILKLAQRFYGKAALT